MTQMIDKDKLLSRLVNVRKLVQVLTPPRLLGTEEDYGYAKGALKVLDTLIRALEDGDYDAEPEPQEGAVMVFAVDFEDTPDEPIPYTLTGRGYEDFTPMT